MIQTHVLKDVATYLNGRVAKVVLNGTFEITNFKVKQVTDSTLVLNYLVPVASIGNINLIELKDATNAVLTSNAVEIPITSDTLMLQTILVKEVAG